MRKNFEQSTYSSAQRAAPAEYEAVRDRFPVEARSLLDNLRRQILALEAEMGIKKGDDVRAIASREDISTDKLDRMAALIKRFRACFEAEKVPKDEIGRAAREASVAFSEFSERIDDVFKGGTQNLDTRQIVLGEVACAGEPLLAWQLRKDLGWAADSNANLDIEIGALIDLYASHQRAGRDFSITALAIVRSLGEIEPDPSVRDPIAVRMTREFLRYGDQQHAEMAVALIIDLPDFRSLVREVELGKNGALAKAREEYGREPQNVWRSYDLAMAYARSGMAAECVDTIRAAPRDPFDYDGFGVIVDALIETHHLDAAVTLLNEFPDDMNSPVVATIVSELVRAGRVSEAMVQWKQHGVLRDFPYVFEIAAGLLLACADMGIEPDPDIRAALEQSYQKGNKLRYGWSEREASYAALNVGIALRRFKRAAFTLRQPGIRAQLPGLIRQGLPRPVLEGIALAITPAALSDMVPSLPKVEITDPNYKLLTYDPAYE